MTILFCRDKGGASGRLAHAPRFRCRARPFIAARATRVGPADALPHFRTTNDRYASRHTSLARAILDHQWQRSALRRDGHRRRADGSDSAASAPRDRMDSWCVGRRREMRAVAQSQFLSIFGGNERGSVGLCRCRTRLYRPRQPGDAPVSGRPRYRECGTRCGAGGEGDSGYRRWKQLRRVGRIAGRARRAVDGRVGPFLRARPDARRDRSRSAADRSRCQPARRRRVHARRQP